MTLASDRFLCALFHTIQSNRLQYSCCFALSAEAIATFVSDRPVLVSSCCRSCSLALPQSTAIFADWISLSGQVFRFDWMVNASAVYLCKLFLHLNLCWISVALALIYYHPSSSFASSHSYYALMPACLSVQFTAFYNLLLVSYHYFGQLQTSQRLVCSIWRAHRHDRISEQICWNLLDLRTELKSVNLSSFQCRFPKLSISRLNWLQT